MASYSVHAEKAEMFESLSRKHIASNGNPFLTVNLVMYTVGHLIEALLAKRGRHPGAPARGVPHADRGALMKSVLIAEGLLDNKDAEIYGKLVMDRDTFIEGGIPDQDRLQAYVKTAEPLIATLRNLVNKGA